MITCDKCGFQNEEESVYCSKCSAELKTTDKCSETTASFESLKTETKEEFFEEFKSDENIASFVVKKGPNVGERFNLTKNKITLGREPESDIFLNDVTVSRKHAVVAYESPCFFITDEGSLNGTYVNRERVGKTILNSNDEIQIGKFILIFLQPKLT